MQRLVFNKPGASRDKIALARAMRSWPTEAEATLWAALRRRRLGGWKFRRQQVIAGYIVDFYCASLWLAIEVDGEVHVGRRQQDQQRDDDLAVLGVHIVRVLNCDVLERLDAVLVELTRLCERIADGSFPPPRGGKAGMGGR